MCPHALLACALLTGLPREAGRAVEGPEERANPAEPWRITAPAGLDPADPAAVFTFLFHRLPDEVTVLPTENYYYWRLHCGRHEWRGNIRLASGQREKGLLSFAAAEYPSGGDGPPAGTWARTFSRSEGVVLICPDALSAVVVFEGRRVLFRFHDIPQLPPPPGVLLADEVFVSRTFDESGLPFYLCFHLLERRFFWVLNDEAPVPEEFDEPAPGLLAGRRSGFLFRLESGRSARKILAGVARKSVQSNDAYDGPFDQLADNYAAQTPLRKYVELAYPELKGRVDQYGYLSGGPKPARVALTGYLIYNSLPEAIALLTEKRENPSPAVEPPPL